MKIKILTIIISVLSTLQAAAQKTLYFDSTEHFIKQIAFVLKNDTTTNKADTLYQSIKYITTEATFWESHYNGWRTYKNFETIMQDFYPPDLVSKIDSVFFEEKYTITSFKVTIVCNGGEKQYDLKPPCLSKELKDELAQYNKATKCRITFYLKVENQDGQQQELNIRVY